MAFVPGFDHDVFISYSWADNRTKWVTNLTQALKDRVHELLGEEPDVWRDEQQLSGEHNFTEEIEARLKQTAVLALVVGPGYFKSGFCADERDCFERHATNGTSVGTRKKIVKAVKRPDENGLHRTMLGEEIGFSFYTGKTAQDAVEFYPGDRDFNFEVDRLAKGVCNILRDMRNQRTPVYVSEPAPPEAISGWQRLRDELKSYGFRVLPSFRLRDSFKTEILLPEMKPAAVSVHLLGAAWSDFSKLQIDLARKMTSSAVIWLPPGSEPDSRQREYLDTLNGFKRLTILRTTDYWDLAKIVSEEAKPKPTAPAAPADGRRKIYLLCDRTDPDDESQALLLRDAILEREGLEVILPEKDRDAKIVDDHQQRCLAECDGVLVYWGRAGKEWFKENYYDLRAADQARQVGKPILSRRIAIARQEGDPDNLAPPSWVIPYRGPGLESLEAFLQPLRTGAGAMGRA